MPILAIEVSSSHSFDILSTVGCTWVFSALICMKRLKCGIWFLITSALFKRDKFNISNKYVT